MAKDKSQRSRGGLSVAAPPSKEGISTRAAEAEPLDIGAMTKVELLSLVTQQKEKIGSLEVSLEERKGEVERMVQSQEVFGSAEVLGLMDAIPGDEEDSMTVVDSARGIGESIISVMGSRDWRTGERGLHHVNKVALIGALIVLRQTGLLAICGLKAPLDIPSTLRDFIGDKRKGVATALGLRASVVAA